MKKLTTIIIQLFSLYANAQVVCGTANENGIVTLTAPAGNTFTTIEFASYGTPNGACGSFTIGGCHAANSVSVCSAAFLGLNSASIAASNGVFGDPCGGTPKRLYIQARYSSVLPLTLLSFTAQKIGQDKVRLNWSSDHELNTSHFVIERSIDGILFEAMGSVPATGSGENSYSFINIVPGIAAIYYYRLKMVDTGGEHLYSSIIRINNNVDDVKLAVFPNPADRSITITSNKQQEALIANITGQLLKRINLINGSQTVNITDLAPGVYFIKTGAGVIKFVKR